MNKIRSQSHSRTFYVPSSLCFEMKAHVTEKTILVVFVSVILFSLNHTLHDCLLILMKLLVML